VVYFMENPIENGWYGGGGTPLSGNLNIWGFTMFSSNFALQQIQWCRWSRLVPEPTFLPVEKTSLNLAVAEALFLCFVLLFAGLKDDHGEISFGELLFPIDHLGYLSSLAPPTPWS
jgi:hypothetical protein